MFGRQKALAHLHEELETIALFDRVHEYVTDPSPADNRAYASRQIRRSQILVEISKLSAPKPVFSEARIGSAVLLLCGVGYASLHYLLK
jgi:hypothetical protein